jgi:16S rRNA processing protein RimM
MKLYSVDDRDRAAEVRGALVCVRRNQFPPLGEGEFYVCDAKGAKVTWDDREIGTVADVRNYPSVDALVVKAADGGKDWEIPLVDVFIGSVDTAAGRIVLKTMDGLERG